jgi:hypothetical protein
LIILCFFSFTLNPLNAELNPICDLLVLLGDLTFMGTYIVSIFQYISKKMQRYTVYLYLKLFYMFRVVLPPIIRSAYTPPTAHSNLFQLFHDSGR